MVSPGAIALVGLWCLGAALLAALCFSTILAISLASYLTLCYRTLELSSRSMQNTQAVELAETGMEEAIWALNKNDWSLWTIAGTTATRTITGFTFDNHVTGSVELIAITNGVEPTMPTGRKSFVIM